MDSGAVVPPMDRRRPPSLALDAFFHRSSARRKCESSPRVDGNGDSVCVFSGGRARAGGEGGMFQNFAEVRDMEQEERKWIPQREGRREGRKEGGISSLLHEPMHF